VCIHRRLDPLGVGHLAPGVEPVPEGDDTGLRQCDPDGLKDLFFGTPKSSAILMWHWMCPLPPLMTVRLTITMSSFVAVEAPLL
jgi:hypothetical protein